MKTPGQEHDAFQWLLAVNYNPDSSNLERVIARLANQYLDKQHWRSTAMDEVAEIIGEYQSSLDHRNALKRLRQLTQKNN